MAILKAGQKNSSFIQKIVRKKERKLKRPFFHNHFSQKQCSLKKENLSEIVCSKKCVLKIMIDKKRLIL